MAETGGYPPLGRHSRHCPPTPLPGAGGAACGAPPVRRPAAHRHWRALPDAPVPVGVRASASAAIRHSRPLDGGEFSLFGGMVCVGGCVGGVLLDSKSRWGGG